MIPADVEMTYSNIVAQTPVRTAHKEKGQPKVKVFCRIKPSSQGQSMIGMEIAKQKTQLIFNQPKINSEKIFTFNHIYVDQSQQDFVTEICEPILKNFEEKKKGALVFSYGVTNSGKTYTILGSLKSPGILPYLIKNLKGTTYISAIQLYNDQFFSLTNKEKVFPKQVGGLYDLKKCGVQEEINQSNMEEKLKKYVENRSQSNTKINMKSSRSHAIFRIQNNGIVLGVVDLAGSQRMNKVDSSLDETSNINKSLLSLGKCIKALTSTTDKTPQLPYRQSKLTRVLMEYFISQTKIVMIANIHPLQSFYHENIKVLDYASLAKQIKHHHELKEMLKSSMKNYLENSKLKSSKKNQGPVIHSIKKKQNEQFAKALKIRQLQACLKKFEGGQQSFDFFFDQTMQQERENDQYKLKKMRIDVYKSPLPQKNEVSVEVSCQQDIRKNKESYKLQLMKELKEKIEQERRVKLVDQETFMSPTFSKEKSVFFCHQKQKSQRTETPNKVNKKTPQKTPNVVSKLMNSLNSAYSSAKKIFTYSKVKKEEKIKKFQIYEVIRYCIYENILHKQTENGEINSPDQENESKKDCYVQTEVIGEASDPQIRKSFSVCIKQKKVYFSENNDTTENSDNLTETSGDNDTDHFKIVRREKKKSKRTKSKVAIVREKAAKICRQNSRTPMKCRLRKRQKK